MTDSHSYPETAELARKAALFREGTKRIYEGQGASADMWYFELFHFLDDVQKALSDAQAVPDYFEVAGKLGAALVQIAGMDPKECRADDLGRAARIAREALAPSVPSTDPRCTCAAIVNPNIPHARTCPLASPESK